jgi:hypothetical protein
MVPAGEDSPEPSVDAEAPRPPAGDPPVDPGAPDEPAGADSYDPARIPRPGRPPHTPPDTGPPAADRMIAVAAGDFLRGSFPGFPGRDPLKEVDLVPTPVAAFEIDLLPYPNDPERPSETLVTRSQAEAKCRAAGKRLCTEVEWEYACKGTTNREYPYGDDYDPARHVGPLGPASPFGVLGMTLAYEWTAGDWLDLRGGASSTMLPARGAHPEDGDERTRRCAARTGLAPDLASPRVGFRCCRGEGFPGSYAVERIEPAVAPAPLINDRMLSRIVRSIPELRRIHEAPRLQGEDVLRRALLRSRKTEAVGVGFVISTQPVFWRPTAGEEVMVLTGRHGRNVFTAALYTTGVPGLYRHAASLILTEVSDDQGITLFGGFRDRKLLGWGECDDCREGGSYAYDETTGRITIGHRW